MFSLRPLLPERGQQTANQDSETDKIHACPFHGGPPD
jgi:hypothetical protein